MATRISKLFGMDIYSSEGEYKGKIFDLVINLEKGRIETITTEPLKPRTKQEAKKILSEKSVPYRYVVSAKDIVVINPSKRQDYKDEEEEAAQPAQRKPYLPRRGYGR